MHRLTPDPGPTDLETELAGYRPAEAAPEDRPWVAVNMITTLDGRAALDGDTKRLGSEADTEHLLALRTRFDAVMIGGGTMRAERYGPIISRPENRALRENQGLDPDALAVLISGDLNLPFDAPLFTSGRGRVLIFSRATEVPPTVTPIDLMTVEGTVSTTEVLKYLRQERGITSVLCEGGPHLFGQLVAADQVDEFFLTITPVIIGGDSPRIIEGDLPDQAGFELKSLNKSQGDLFARYHRV